jgi:hypothetical protein
VAGATYGAVETFTTAVVLPRAVTTAADGVSTTGATLAGTVDPRRAPVTHWFEWGTSTAYGNTTPAGPLAEPGTIPRPVEARIEGLAPGVTYHYRLVARSAAGDAAGEDREFTTATDPVPGAAEPLPTDPASPSDVPQQPETPGSGPAPVPAFGRSVAASVVSGTVRVRLPGQGYVALDGASSVPNGALVDARKGTLNVVSALDDAGHTQRATFRGARFTITQARSGRGMVDIRLHEAPTGCRTAAAVARTSAKRKKPPTLWAKDRHGKFRTHGRNSVATVRGTVWSTTETCAGTRTTVERGKVAVVSRTTHRRVLVRAGHSLLARAAR